MTIDVSYSEEQELISQSARDFFARECPPAAIRRAEAAQEEFPAGLWKKMAELGWLGMSFPEAHGGAGCSLLDLVPLYTELGRHIAPVPLLDVAGIAGELVAAAGNDDQKRRILPNIAAGELVVVPAVMEPEGVYGARGVRMEGRRQGGEFVLEGTKTLVPCARSAGLIVVAARTGPGKGNEGITLLLVEPGARGVTTEVTKTLTGERLHAVTFSGVVVEAADVLGAVDGGGTVLDDVLMKAAVLQCAIAVGGGERVLDITAGYARDRVQFGKAIGSYQAVQYLVSDIAIDIHLARLLMLQAAWRVSSGRSWKREASLAKAAASRASAVLINRSHEVHAGIGFMLDYDLQLFTRRAKHWEWNLGDYRYHLDRSLAEAGI